MAASPRGQAFWQPHIQALNETGQTLRGYAREHGLSVDALGWWRRKLKAAAPAQPFVALSVQEADTPAPALLTVSIGRLCLAFSHPPDVVWLVRLNAQFDEAR